MLTACSHFFRKNAFKTSPLIILLVAASGSLFAQANAQPETGSWLMYFGQLRVHDKWSIHAEAQFRDYGILDQPEQILLRGGLNYHYSPNAVFSGGYGRITNYPFDDEFSQSASVKENRIWQQVLMRNTVGRVYFEHRYRLEQRWIKSEAGERYADRARYLLRATVPLNKKEITRNTLFATGYDEVFLNFSRSAFDRNRLYGALGYQFSPAGNVQLGYLAQTVNANTKHYLQAGLTYTIDLRKKK